MPGRDPTSNMQEILVNVRLGYRYHFLNLLTIGVYFCVSHIGRPIRNPMIYTDVSFTHKTHKPCYISVAIRLSIFAFIRALDSNRECTMPAERVHSLHCNHHTHRVLGSKFYRYLTSGPEIPPAFPSTSTNHEAISALSGMV